MQFQIKNFDGEMIEAELSSVQSVFPDDDVIYIDDNPCLLSSAHPATEMNEYEVSLIVEALRFMASKITGGSYVWKTPLHKAEQLTALADYLKGE